MWQAPGTACAPQLLNAHSRTQQASGVLLYCIVHLDDVNFSGVIFDLNGREDQTKFHNKGKFYFWDSHESSGMRPYLRNESETLNPLAPEFFSPLPHLTFSGALAYSLEKARGVFRALAYSSEKARGAFRGHFQTQNAQHVLVA